MEYRKGVYDVAWMIVKEKKDDTFPVKIVDVRVQDGEVVVVTEPLNSRT